MSTWSEEALEQVVAIRASDFIDVADDDEWKKRFCEKRDVIRRMAREALEEEGRGRDDSSRRSALNAGCSALPLGRRTGFESGAQVDPPSPSSSSLNSSPAGRRQALNIRAAVHEVIRPPVSPGMKQNLQLASHRIDSAEVRAFVQIAAMASKREITEIVAPAVLTGDYVFDLMRHRAVRLAKPTVLAPICRPGADEKPRGGIHR
jgi:hypothetical protein